MKEKLQKLFEKYKFPILEFKGKCNDCKKAVSVEIRMEEDGKTVISGGAVYLPAENDYNAKTYVKCDSCFEQAPILSNFRECEVYSRVVGYLRPVKQWNPGKTEEFKERALFNIKTLDENAKTGKKPS